MVLHPQVEIAMGVEKPSWNRCFGFFLGSFNSSLYEISKESYKSITYQINLVPNVKTTVVIKDVDEEAYRNFKGEAAKLGLKVGEAASEAFRLWGHRRALLMLKDRSRMEHAAKIIDGIRTNLEPIEDWNAVEEIRKWRDSRRSS